MSALWERRYTIFQAGLPSGVKYAGTSDLLLTRRRDFERFRVLECMFYSATLNGIV